MANPLFGTRNYFNYVGSPYIYPSTTPSMVPNYVSYTNPAGNGTVFASKPPAQQTSPVTQAIQSMTPQSNIIWIDNKSEIDSYPTGRGWQQWFGDKNRPYLYVREMDMNGVIQPIKTVRFQIEDDAPPVQDAVTEPAKEEAKSADVPTREEFDKLSESVNMLVDKLSDLLK